MRWYRRRRRRHHQQNSYIIINNTTTATTTAIIISNNSNIRTINTTVNTATTGNKQPYVHSFIHRILSWFKCSPFECLTIPVELRTTP